MRKFVPALSRLAVAGVVAGLVATQAGAASAATTLDIADQATLVARGAAVVIEVTASCDPVPAYPFPSGVFVSISQRSGSRVVTAGDVAYLVCTGEPQTLSMSLTSSGGVLKKGVAWATAEQSGPTGPGPSVGKEITIVRP